MCVPTLVGERDVHDPQNVMYPVHDVGSMP